MDSLMPFLIGGTSGCIATMFIQPIDLVKVTIQIKSQEASKLGKKQSISPFKVIKQITAQSGFLSFYRGLDAAIARQIFYTTTRLGKNLSFGQKAFCGGFAGLIGSIVGNPADLALIRIQADSKLPPQQKRNYTSVVNAFTRISKQQGVMALWRGCTPTVIRAIVLNLVMLATYQQLKDRLCQFMGSKQTQGIRLAASAVSGFFSSFSALPFDNSKTKIQKMTKGSDGTFPYKNIFDAMLKTVKSQGVAGLWVGFPTFYFRIAPHVMITLVVQDALTDIYKKSKVKN